MGDLRLNNNSYSGYGTGVLMLNGVNYTGGASGGGGVDYIESWILKSGSSVSVPTIVIHQEFTDGKLSSIDVKEQGGNSSVVNGDITTYIGSDSNWLWKATATDDMTYKLYNVNTQTEGPLQTAQANDVIINDGDLNTYCMEIRRYS